MLDTTNQESSFLRTIDTKNTGLDEYRRVKATYGWVWYENNPNPHFSLTCEGWYPENKTSEPSTGGADSELACQVFPWLRLMSTVHLADALTGEPIYAVENGWYWLQDQAPRYVPPKWLHLEPVQRSAAYLGCDPSLLAGVTSKEELEQVASEKLAGIWLSLKDIVMQTYGLTPPTPRP